MVASQQLILDRLNEIAAAVGVLTDKVGHIQVLDDRVERLDEVQDKLEKDLRSVESSMNTKMQGVTTEINSLRGLMQTELSGIRLAMTQNEATARTTAAEQRGMWSVIGAVTEKFFMPLLLAAITGLFAWYVGSHGMK